MAGLEGKTFVEKYILEPRYVTNTNGDTTHYYTEYVDIDSTRFKNEGRFCYVSPKGYLEYYVYGDLFRSDKIESISIRDDGSIVVGYEYEEDVIYRPMFIADTLNGQVVYDVKDEFIDSPGLPWFWTSDYTNGSPQSNVDVLRNASLFVLE